MLVAVAACPFVLAQAFAGGSPGRAGAAIAGPVTRSATPLHGLLARVAARELLLERAQHARVAARRAREGWGYGLPVTVRRVIAAGNRIARLPYHYGGGHGSFEDSGYDCSGSVSYALHGGGLLDVALDSGQLMSWGEPGPGRWITVYAMASHAYMVVAGHRFDTTGRERTGSRWQTVPGGTAGYVVRHPPGL
jgi:cell wall-associated NlpC family hydrolase